MQPALLVLTLIDLGLFTKYASTKVNPRLQRICELGILLTSSILAQALILSSGGIYGPFFILTYLFALGLGLFIGLAASVAFLVGILGLMIWQVSANPQIEEMFKNDPWLGVLYVTSMFVVVPLMHYLTKTYHLKDNLSKKLVSYLATSTKREASILESLNEIVIVTDTGMKVLSVNEAAEKIFKTDEAAMVNKEILEALSLNDDQGKKADREGLSIDNILRDRASRIVEGYLLDLPGAAHPAKVRIQVRPVDDQEGKIAQLIFVITEVTATPGNELHADLKSAEEKASLIQKDLGQNLIGKNPVLEQIKFEALKNIEEDLRLAQDLEDHPIKKDIQIESVAFITGESMNLLKQFADLQGISIVMNLPEGDIPQESSYQELKKTPNTSESMVSSIYSASFDRKWYSLFVVYILRLHLVFAPEPKYGITISLSRSDEDIKIEFMSHPAVNLSGKTDRILKQYYPELPVSANASLSSGLEGFIASTIATQLDIRLECEIIESAGILKITATINKSPSV